MASQLAVRQFRAAAGLPPPEEEEEGEEGARPFTDDAQYDHGEALARIDPLAPRANRAARTVKGGGAAAAKPAARGRRRLGRPVTWEAAASDGRAELAVVLNAVPHGSPEERVGPAPLNRQIGSPRSPWLLEQMGSPRRGSASFSVIA